MNNNEKHELFDECETISNIIGNRIRTEMTGIVYKTMAIAERRAYSDALNKFRTTNAEEFEDWLMDQIQN